MSSSLTGEEMIDFRGGGLYSVGCLSGQRSAHIYCGSDVQSLCHNSRRDNPGLAEGHRLRFSHGYFAGELTCQKCLAKYRRLKAQP